MSEPMRDAVRRLSRRATVAVVSGRAREKIREFVDLSDLYYAGSHGFDIDGPGGLRHAVSQDAVPLLASARHTLEGRLRGVQGCSLEDNRYSVSVHWRKCELAARQTVERVVDEVVATAPFAGALRKTQGKCVYELKPNVRWDKGEAVLYLLDMLRRTQQGETTDADDWYRGVLPVYVGDDTTDEDAFKALSQFGAVSVLVAPKTDEERPRMTHATHTLKDVDDVMTFIDALATNAAQVAAPS